MVAGIKAVVGGENSTYNILIEFQVKRHPGVEAWSIRSRLHQSTKDPFMTEIAEHYNPIGNTDTLGVWRKNVYAGPHSRGSYLRSANSGHLRNHFGEWYAAGSAHRRS